MPYFHIKQTVTFLASIMTMLISATTLANNEILLLDNESQQHAISEFIGRGKWSVVNIWGVNCPPCREEMPELVMLHDKYSASVLTVLGIAIDFPSFGYAKIDSVNQFMDEFLVDFPVLLSDESISKKLGAGYLQGLPTTYIYTPGGELIGQQTGGIDRKTILDFITKRGGTIPPEK